MKKYRLSATVSAVKPTNLLHYWAMRRARNEVAVEAGQCVIYRAHTGGKIHVASPRNQEFIDGARQLRGAYWMPSEMAWAFHPVALPSVLSLCSRIYGGDKVVNRLTR